MEIDPFTLELTAGVFRDIASGNLCASNSIVIGRFTFFFQVSADRDDGCNTEKRKLHLSVVCQAFIGQNTPWDCTLKIEEVHTTLPHMINIGSEMEYTNKVDTHLSHLSDVASATALRDSTTISITFSIVGVSEMRFLVNNFRNDMNGVNCFQFIVGQDEVDLYGNENFLKFHSPNICDSPLLPDVNPYEFHEFLEMLYDNGCTLTEVNVSFVLSLAQRFRVARLLDMAENFLLDSLKGNHTISWFHDVIKWSCIHDLVNLRFEAVKMFVTVEQYGNFMKEQQYRSLEDKHKLLLNQQVLIELKA